VKSFAPMVLKNSDRQDVLFGDMLKDLDKPYFYVGFISANNTLCPDCVSETDVLMRISKELYRDSLQIIFINVDDEFMRYYYDHRAFDAKKYNVPYLYFNKQISLMRSLDAVHFPCYFLLDRTGAVLQSDFAKPSEGLAEKLKSFFVER
jgi:thiol-disulfide isomerase/thioredoxin